MGILLERTVVKGPKFFSVQSVFISSLLIESGQCYITVIKLSSAIALTMSDLPELPLFEEIEDISNSSDFFTYTQDEFNKTWSYYEDEATSESKTSGLWTTPVRNVVSPTFPNKTSPTRDTWDPMLWNINLTKYVELNLEDDVQIRKLPELETPITPLPMEEDSNLNTVSKPVTSVLDESSKLIGTTLSVPDVFMSDDVSTSIFGSNQIPLTEERSRSKSPSVSRKLVRPPSPRSLRRKLFTKESQIMSRRKGFNCQMKGIQKVNFPIVKKSTQNRKRKLYEMGPFSDPTKERERMNALNAKRNRDRKKSLIGDAEQQILKLKSLNKKLLKDATMDKKKLDAAQREIKLLKSRLQSPTNLNRSY